MKTIFAFATALMLVHGAVFAQKLKTVPEKDVKLSYVKDFQRQVQNATNVVWYEVNEQTYKVTYLDEEKSRQAMLFNNKGSETHYYVDKQYVPTAIKDTVKHLFPKYKLQDCWVRKMRGKMTYQTLIAKESGWLWWRKTTDPKTLSFEVDGKFIKVE